MMGAKLFMNLQNLTTLWYNISVATLSGRKEVVSSGEYYRLYHLLSSQRSQLLPVQVVGSR